MNGRSRDWPPDATPPDQPPPPLRVVVTLLLIAALVLGAPLAWWVVASLPGAHPYAPVIIPGCLFTALLVFLTGIFIDHHVRSRK